LSAAGDWRSNMYWECCLQATASTPCWRGARGWNGRMSSRAWPMPTASSLTSALSLGARGYRILLIDMRMGNLWSVTRPHCALDAVSLPKKRDLEISNHARPAVFRSGAASRRPCTCGARTTANCADTSGVTFRRARRGPHRRFGSAGGVSRCGVDFCSVGHRSCLSGRTDGGPPCVSTVPRSLYGRFAPGLAADTRRPVPRRDIRVPETYPKILLSRKRP